MVLNSKGQVTIPAHLRAKYDLHVGDEIEVVDVNGTLQIVRAEGLETKGQRLVRRLRNTASSGCRWAEHRPDHGAAPWRVTRELTLVRTTDARVDTKTCSAAWETLG